MDGLDVKSYVAGVLSPLLVLAGVKMGRSLVAPSIKADREPHPQGLKVVITGSTRGLGYHLARQFLSLGDDVVISSRSAAAVEEAAAKLREEFPGCQVVGVPCDVSKPGDVERLCAKAVEELGQIDMMVCNAAQSQKVKTPVASTAAGELTSIVATNLGGSLLCARGAIAHMMHQASGGKVFLVDGNGSMGNATPGNSAYGATKRAVVQLKDSLAAEVKGSAVSVHLFSPGMVATDLLLRLADNPRSARVVNILAEEPATVAAWLVPRLRGVEGNGQYIRFLTMAGVAWRFATASSRKGRFVPEGNSAGYQRLAHAG